jgi:hypothetical protein
MIAKYKKPLGMWLLFWCIWLVITASTWPMGKTYSPLLWPNVWGVIDWLGSSAIFVALWLASGHEFHRNLPKQTRFQDALTLLYFLARGFGFLALLFAIGAARISLYRHEVQGDLGWFLTWRPEPAILHFPVIICIFASVSGAVAFVGGVIAIVLRKYDDAERT